jgi:hypothetical protein
MDCLLWDLTWGRQFTFLREIAEGTGKVPQALLDRPKLEPPNRIYIESFYELSMGRSMGESLAGRFSQPLEVSEITGYAQKVLGMRSAEELDRFLGRVRRLDTAYLGHEAKTAAARKPAT